MNDKLFLDTNILVYTIDETQPQKRKRAQELMDGCFEGKVNYCISTQTISELFVVLTKKMKAMISIKDTQDICIRLLDYEGIEKLKITENTIKKAMKITEQNNIHYWDCLIAATMIENGVGTIITENTKHFEKIPGIKAQNPFV